jgi:hypothetical protein
MCQECQEIEVGYFEGSEAWDNTVVYKTEEVLLGSGIKEEVSGKICTKCGEWKPFSEFSKDKKMKDGLNVWCRSCASVYIKWYKSSEYVPVRTVLTITADKKQCGGCLCLLPFSEFYKNKRLKGGLDFLCKSCTLEKKRERSNKVNFEPDLTVIKVCTKCGVLKGAHEYYACRLQTDGLESACKSCSSAAAVVWKASRNFEPLLFGTKTCKACSILKDVQDFPKCRYKEDGLSSYCRDCKNAKAREYRGTHLEFRLQESVRGRFRKFLEKAGLDTEIYNGAAIEFMGCTIEELSSYLEEMFYENSKTFEKMTWENHSTKGWHIDHIISLSSVDLTDPRQLKRVCHFSNLRPLWGKENCSKQAKLPKNWDKEAWLREIENE